MLEAHKIELKRSRLRERMFELAKTENRTAEQNSEFEKTTNELGATEVELRAAMELQEQSVSEDSGQKAKQKLEERAAALDECWMLKVARGEQINDGPIREYRDEEGLADDEVDINLLIERRADVPTPGPNAQAQAAPIAGRVFRPTVLSSLGISSQRVSPAQHNYTVLTTGTTAEMKDLDELQESTAAAFTITSLTPRQVRGRVTVRTRELAIFPMYEAALRRDLGSQLDDVISNQIINGNQSSRSEVGGLATTLTAVATPTGGVVNFEGFVNLLPAMVDGTYANSTRDLRVILGLQTWRLAFSTQKSAESDLYAMDWLNQKAQSVNLSSFIPAAPSSGTEENGQRVFATKARGLGQSYAFPVWAGVTITRDRVSSVARGHIHITAELNFNFRITRLQNWVRTTLAVAA